MIEINLLPKEYGKKSFDFSFGKTGLYMIGGAAAVVLMLVGVTIHQTYQLDRLDSNIEKAGRRAEMLQKDIHLVDALLEVKDKISQRMTAVERLDSRRSAWVRILEDISRNVPEFVWLARFEEQAPKTDNDARNRKRSSNKSKKTGKPGEVNQQAGNEIDTTAESRPEIPNENPAEVEGYAFTLNALASLMINMMRSDYFDDVELVSTTETELEEHKAYNFILTCTVHYLSDDELRDLVAQSGEQKKSGKETADHKVLN